MAIVGAGILSGSLPSAEAGQAVAGFNRDWRFSLAPQTEAHLPGFDDSAWRCLDLPHDWVVENACSSNLPFYKATGVIPGAGIGWYRKTFRAGDLSDRTATVLFDGVYNNAETWINGQRLGFHPYGYSPFHYDLTPYLKADEENVLVVKVDHTRYADSRWYTGAGIYRNVELIISGRIHVPMWGTFVTTPKVSTEAAKVVVETQVRNGYDTDRQVELRTTLLDPDGKIAATASSTKGIKAFARHPFRTELDVVSPSLWSIGQPSLCTAVSQVVLDGRVVDESTTRFGIRSIRFDADQGFFLNGENLKIKGVCLHHDGGLAGAAVPKGVWRRRLEILKAAGCNAIRSAHNPASNEFLDLCDEMGFLVQDEFFDEWDNPKDKRFNMAQREVHYETQGYVEHFQEWAERDLKATVLSHRNHPSVFQWSIGNEIEWTYPRNKKATGFFDNMDWSGNYFWSLPPFSVEEIKHQLATLPRERYDIGETARKLAQWTRELDTTRPVIANCILPSASHFSGYAAALDIVGYSYRRVLYDYGHDVLPNKPIMGTENVPQWHEWKAVEERPHIAGTFLWTGISYMGELHDPYPAKTLDVGLLDTAGFARPSYHMYKSLWNPAPAISLTSQALGQAMLGGKPLYAVDAEGQVRPLDPEGWQHMLWSWYDVNQHWNYAPGETVVVEACSNCDEAELFLNGRSLGRKRLADFADRIMKWAVPFEAGTLQVKGWKDGMEVSDTLATHGEPAAVHMEIDRTTLSADGRDVAHVVVQLVDAAGKPVRSQEREVVFEIGRGLKALGVDNGHYRNVQDFHSNRIVTSRGRALLVVQAGYAPATTGIRASGEHLAADEATIGIE